MQQILNRGPKAGHYIAETLQQASCATCQLHVGTPPLMKRVTDNSRRAVPVPHNLAFLLQAVQKVDLAGASDKVFMHGDLKSKNIGISNVVGLQVSMHEAMLMDTDQV